MIVEVKSKSMANFVFLETVKVKAKNPNVKYKNADSSVCGKISGKDRIIFNTETHEFDDEDKDAKDNKTGSNSNPHEKVLLFCAIILFMSSISQKLPCIFAVHLLILLNIEILNLLDIVFLNSSHPINFIVICFGSGNVLFSVFFMFLQYFSLRL